MRDIAWECSSCGMKGEVDIAPGQDPIMAAVVEHNEDFPQCKNPMLTVTEDFI